MLQPFIPGKSPSDIAPYPPGLKFHSYQDGADSLKNCCLCFRSLIALQGGGEGARTMRPLSKSAGWKSDIRVSTSVQGRAARLNLEIQRLDRIGKKTTDDPVLRNNLHFWELAKLPWLVKNSVFSVFSFSFSLFPRLALPPFLSSFRYLFSPSSLYFVSLSLILFFDPISV